MSPARIAGIVLLVVGLALLIFGYNASQSVGEQLSETITGRFSDKTTWMIIGGIAALVAGAALAMFGGGRRAGI